MTFKIWAYLELNCPVFECVGGIVSKDLSKRNINFVILIESQLVKTLRQTLTSEVLEIKTSQNPTFFFHFDKSEVSSGLRM